MCTAAPSSRTSTMRTPKLRQVVPDRLDVAALQAEDAVDAAATQEARDQFGDAAVGGGGQRGSWTVSGSEDRV